MQGVGGLGLGSAEPGANTLVIGAEDDWPPYSHSVAGLAEPQGLAPRLVRLAFETQGVSVRYRSLPFARCLLEARLGKVAGCFNVTRTEANANDFHWHATPMFEEELAIFGRAAARRSSSDALLGLGDLVGRSVGITVGYTYPPAFMNDPRIVRRQATSDLSLLRMLAAGHVDFVLINTLPAAYRLAAEPALQGKVIRVGVIRQDGFWLAFSKAHPDSESLAQTFERGLQALRKDGRHERMLSDWRRQWRPLVQLEALP